MTDTVPATILFADIAGSTALYEAAGDTVALSSVNTCLDALKRIAQANSGAVIKTLGDEILCSFMRSDDAILAANAMQSSVSSGKLQLRIGVHHGPVVFANGDVYGDTVNLAARIVSLANPGQVLTSRPTYDAMSDFLKASCRRLYSTAVKGRNEKVTIFEAIWRQDDGLTVVADNDDPITDNQRTALALSHRGQDWTVDQNEPALTIGRDAKNRLAVDLPSASRNHATVVLRKGRYVLTDLSSNGTYVALADGGEFVLRHEELVLSGSGAIALGCPVKQCGELIIEFEVQRL